MSKGDNRRPTMVDDEEMERRWKLAFCTKVGTNKQKPTKVK
jgi:hypothetical protein